MTGEVKKRDRLHPYFLSMAMRAIKRIRLKIRGEHASSPIFFLRLTAFASAVDLKAAVSSL
jgi:hypothetical protein